MFFGNSIGVTIKESNKLTEYYERYEIRKDDIVRMRLQSQPDRPCTIYLWLDHGQTTRCYCVCVSMIALFHNHKPRARAHAIDMHAAQHRTRQRAGCPFECPAECFAGDKWNIHEQERAAASHRHHDKIPSSPRVHEFARNVLHYPPSILLHETEARSLRLGGVFVAVHICPQIIIIK